MLEAGVLSTCTVDFLELLYLLVHTCSLRMLVFIIHSLMVSRVLHLDCGQRTPVISRDSFQS